MSKPRQPPRRRRSRPAHSEPPRNRLAEIQAEIREVQERIEDSRRARRLIRNAAELTVLEQDLTRLTDRLAKLLIAETLQQTADDQQTNQQARSQFQGARKSGVSSSFLPEKMNRHRITRPSLPGPRRPSLSEGLWRRYNVMIGRCSELSGNIASNTTRRPLRRPLSRHDRRW